MFDDPKHPEYQELIHVVLARGYDFVLFGQENGQYSRATLKERTADFKERYWGEEYQDAYSDMHQKAIFFVPDPTYFVDSCQPV